MWHFGHKKVDNQAISRISYGCLFATPPQKTMVIEKEKILVGIAEYM